MLKELYIQNYKSHKKTVFRFSNGLNLICGTTQAGKSAALSAFTKLVENRPTGAGFYSWFAPEKGKTKIKAVFDNCIIEQIIDVIRKDDEPKAKSTSYILDGKRFRKVGTKIPDQVISAINLQDVNYQKQIDHSFLISDSATAFSKAINNLTGTDQINLCISDVNSEIEKNKKEIEYVKEQISDGRKSLRKMELLDYLSTVKRSVEYYSSKYEDGNELSNAIEDDLIIWKTLKRAIKPLREKLKRLKIILIELEKITEDVEHQSKVLNWLFEYADLFKGIKALLLKKSKVLNEFLTLFKKLGICPYCFSGINNSKVKKIEKEMKNA